MGGASLMGLLTLAGWAALAALFGALSAVQGIYERGPEKETEYQKRLGFGVYLKVRDQEEFKSLFKALVSKAS